MTSARKVSRDARYAVREAGREKLREAVITYFGEVLTVLKLGGSDIPVIEKGEARGKVPGERGCGVSVACDVGVRYTRKMYYCDYISTAP